MSQSDLSFPSYARKTVFSIKIENLSKCEGIRSQKEITKTLSCRNSAISWRISKIFFSSDTWDHTASAQLRKGSQSCPQKFLHPQIAKIRNHHFNYDFEGRRGIFSTQITFSGWKSSLSRCSLIFEASWSDLSFPSYARKIGQKRNINQDPIEKNSKSWKGRGSKTLCSCNSAISRRIFKIFFFSDTRDYTASAQLSKGSQKLPPNIFSPTNCTNYK